MITNGCPENRIDAARMLEFLKKNGCKVTDEYREASLILFNTCAHTQRTEELSVDIINHLGATKSPSAQLIVCGCLPKINKERLRKVYLGDTFGSDDIESLREILSIKMSPEEVHANYLVPCTQSPFVDRVCPPDFRNVPGLMALTDRLISGYMHRFNEVINVFRPHTFCIKVSTGCLHVCSYCAIRFSRGRVKSKPIEKVLKELEEGLRRGYREFALIGTDLGAYGRDRGTNLVELLRELVKHQGEYDIRLRNVHPKFLVEMLPELREIFRGGKISYLSSAAETGNNRILKEMDRGYRIEEFKEAIGALNREFPDLQIRTQLMVGFPGETEEEFQDTLRLLDEVRFDFVEIYVFQSRPRIRAKKMKDHIPQQEARKRAHRLLMKTLFNERRRRRKALREYRATRRKEHRRVILNK